MAKKIEVFDIHDLTCRRPVVRVKKSVALLMIRRQLWEWVVKGESVQWRASGKALKACEVQVHTGYIPEKMPPVEARGCILRRTPAMLRSQAESQCAMLRWQLSTHRLPHEGLENLA